MQSQSLELYSKRILIIKKETYWATPLIFSFDFGNASRHTGDNKLFENAAVRPPDNKSSRLADTSFVELCRLELNEEKNEVNNLDISFIDGR